jgi:hypothetical protein
MGKGMKVEIKGLRSPHLFASRIAPSLMVDVVYVDEVTDEGAIRLSTDPALGDLSAESDRTWLVGQIEAALKYYDEPTTGLVFRFEP